MIVLATTPGKGGIVSTLTPTQYATFMPFFQQCMSFTNIFRWASARDLNLWQVTTAIKIFR